MFEHILSGKALAELRKVGQFASEVRLFFSDAARCHPETSARCPDDGDDDNGESANGRGQVPFWGKSGVFRNTAYGPRIDEDSAPWEASTRGDCRGNVFSGKRSAFGS